MRRVCNKGQNKVGMFSNLKLIHKGLGLVGILLVLELLFVGTLSYLLHETEQSAIREEHSKLIVGRTNIILQLIYDAGQMASDYQNRDGDSECARRYHEDMDQLPKEFKALKKLVANSPRYSKRVADIERSTLNATKLVGRCMDLTESGNKLEALQLAAANRNQFKFLKKNLFDTIRGMMLEQQKVVDEIPAFQAKNRERQKQMLVVGFVANIIFAIALGLFFIKAITLRIDVLVANTKLFANGQQMLPEMSGKDEIALLDHSFHEMTKTLKDLEQRKQQFVSMISHDLRSPLTSLGMFLELLSKGLYGQLNEQGTKKAGVAERSISRLIGLINDLLDFDRLQSGEFVIEKKEESVESVVVRSLDCVHALAERSKIKLESEGANFNANMDGSRIIQVLVNLVSNAVKFSPEQSTIKVCVSHKEGTVEFRVVDQGRGIPKEMLNSVFERFKQVSTTDATEKGGTGLGLAICKAIVECHGGKIGVESEPGHGATFWFTLPDAYIGETRKIETSSEVQA